MQECVADRYHGSRLRFSAFVKAQDVVGGGAIWVRVDDGSGKVLSFQNMQEHPIHGTVAWTRYSLDVDVPSQAAVLYFGLLLHGTGQLWMDDVALDTVGRASEPAHRLPPNVNPSPTNLHFDK